MGAFVYYGNGLATTEFRHLTIVRKVNMPEYRQYPDSAPGGRHAQQRTSRGAAPQARGKAQPGAYRPATVQHAAYRPAQQAARRPVGGGSPYQQHQHPGPGRGKKKGGPWRVVFWIAIVVFVVALAALGAIGFSYWQGQQTYQSVAEEGFTPPDDIAAAPLEEFTVDWDALKAINPDTVGWIYIPGTVVNYPIVQTTDDVKYLTHDFKGSEGWIATFGAIFLSAENASDFSDPNNIIYGHHLNDGSMFACLADFGDAAQFEEHRTVYVLTPEGNYQLNTFSLVHVDADDPLAQTQFADEDERVAYVQDKIDRSVVTASDIPEAAGIAHTFALATCDNLPSDGRYVLYSYVVATTVGQDGGDVVDPEAAAAVDSAEQEIAS